MTNGVCVSVGVPKVPDTGGVRVSAGVPPYGGVDTADTSPDALRAGGVRGCALPDRGRTPAVAGPRWQGAAQIETRGRPTTSLDRSETGETGQPHGDRCGQTGQRVRAPGSTSLSRDRSRPHGDWLFARRSSPSRDAAPVAPSPAAGGPHPLVGRFGSFLEAKPGGAARALGAGSDRGSQSVR